MRTLAGIFVVGTSIAAASDVMPHCGGPTVVVQKPGEECGAHGSRWRGECRAPAQCLSSRKGPPFRCSLYCSNDDDCAPLGAGFRCTGTTQPQTSSEQPRNVCSNDSAPTLQ